MAAAPPGAPGCLGDGAVPAVSAGAAHHSCCGTAEGLQSCSPGRITSPFQSRNGMGKDRGPFQVLFAQSSFMSCGFGWGFLTELHSLRC